MTNGTLPRKISASARIGNAYELRLFALSCLKMISDSTIEHVWHEDSSAAPVDDVIIEFKDRIECFQAKHAMNPHGAHPEDVGGEMRKKDEIIIPPTKMFDYEFTPFREPISRASPLDILL